MEETVWLITQSICSKLQPQVICIMAHAAPTDEQFEMTCWLGHHFFITFFKLCMSYGTVILLDTPPFSGCDILFFKKKRVARMEMGTLKKLCFFTANEVI